MRANRHRYTRFPSLVVDSALNTQSCPRLKRDGLRENAPGGTALGTDYPEEVAMPPRGVERRTTRARPYEHTKRARPRCGQARLPFVGRSRESRCRYRSRHLSPGRRRLISLMERNVNALLRAYHREGDRAARDQALLELMPLVRALANRYSGRGEPLEDLVQVGSLGLI